MVALFKDRSPATIFWLFILCIIVHSNFIVFQPTVHASEQDGLLSIFLNDYIALLSPAILAFLYQAIVIMQALQLNYIFSNNRMYTRVNFLPAMVYILLSGVFKEWSSITPALINNFLVIWLFAKSIRAYNYPNPKTLIFNIGLVVGLSILLYHPSALLILAALFAIMVLRPFVLAEWVILLMGVITPFYFLASYLFLNDKIATFPKFLPNWALNLPDVSAPIPFFVTSGAILLVLLIGLYFWQHENRRLLIQVRKYWTVLLAMLLVLLPAPFINKDAGLESLLLWIVPAAPFMAKGFLGPKKNTLPALLFWLLLGLAIVNNWQLYSLLKFK